jgi:hypothetical protein
LRFQRFIEVNISADNKRKTKQKEKEGKRKGEIGLLTFVLCPKEEE